MTRRDRLWRSIGAAVFIVATAMGLAARGQTLPGLSAFCLALVGIVLIAQGSRVPAALRVERSSHRTLARVIHDRRRRGQDRAPS